MLLVSDGTYTWYAIAASPFVKAKNGFLIRICSIGGGDIFFSLICNLSIVCFVCEMCNSLLMY